MRAALVRRSPMGARSFEPSRWTRRWTYGFTVACVLALLLAGLSLAPTARHLQHMAAVAPEPGTHRPVAQSVHSQVTPGYGVASTGSGLVARNPAQGLRARFTAGGVRISSGRVHLLLGVEAVGFGDRLRAVRSSAPVPRGDRVSYRYPRLRAWYVNGPAGVEQGFTVASPAGAARSGPLTVALRLGGSAARLDPAASAVTIGAGRSQLRYSGLAASDAHGRRLRAWLQLDAGRRLLLRVDARDASYPVRIDPFVKQGSVLSGVAPQQLGTSVAISGDGNTALAGAPGYDSGQGEAYVFVRGSGGQWVQQGKTPLRIPRQGGHPLIGSSAALSANGNLALLGAPNAREVWVFTRSGTTWKLAGLIGAPGSSEFGSSVALSADGNTALIGDQLYQETREGVSQGYGAARVFVRTGETWTQQGPVLAPPARTANAWFGASASLSSDGDTALVTAPFQNGSGAAWIFQRSGEEWTEAAELTGTGGDPEARFGASGALSGDGATALVGAPQEGEDTGAAWVFARSGGTWSQLGPKLVPSEPSPSSFYGEGAALSYDGSTAFVGAFRGPDVMFARSGETWSQQEDVGFGPAVALSPNAGKALTGDGNSLEKGGAAEVFANSSAPAPPTITAIKPNKGSVTGGTGVTITGTGLTGTDEVDFGSGPASSFQVLSSTSIVATAPQEPAGKVYVTALVGGVPNAPVTASLYSFLPELTSVNPDEGPAGGGTRVTLTGVGFSTAPGSTKVKFGATYAPEVSCASTVECQAATPAHEAGGVKVKVVVNKLSSPSLRGYQFTYR
jgi:trimeric autotransporter adhesin